MPVNQNILNGMLKGITDPKLRETYGSIISGKYAYQVFCMAPMINPATKKPFHADKCAIGFVQTNGQVIDTLTVDKKSGDPIAGIETSRDRFDGRKGFRCYCGNWSIQADEEKGVLQAAVVPRAPTREEISMIYENIQKSKKGPLQFIGGSAEYDGFRLEEVKV